MEKLTNKQIKKKLRKSLKEAKKNIANSKRKGWGLVRYEISRKGYVDGKI